jgi:hypothetical protein
MKKLLLFFVLLFSSFVFAGVTGLNYWSGKFDVPSDNPPDTYTLILRSNQETEATGEVVSSDDNRKVLLILEPGSKILNKANSNLTFDSSVTVIMKGATIHSRGKNLSIENLEVLSGFNLVSSSGENGQNGTYRGDKDEEYCGRNCAIHPGCSTDCDLDDLSSCIGLDVKSKDDIIPYRKFPFEYPLKWIQCYQLYCNRDGAAKSGQYAGVLFVATAIVKADVNFSANGGNGGNGIQGCGEKEEGCGEAIRGGNGGEGGNAATVEIENLIVEQGKVNLNAVGGNGGNGGKGGNDIGKDDHDGGWGGNGGASGMIKVANLDNNAAEINVFSLPGRGGLGGKKGGGNDTRSCRGRDGMEGLSKGDFILSSSSGILPKKIYARNIFIEAAPSEDLVFLPDTNYNALEKTRLKGCRISGKGAELSSDATEQISIATKDLDLNVWNPLKFFDRVLLSVAGSVISYKNESCNLNPKRVMVLPFNGRIKDKTTGDFVSEGVVKGIRIVNLFSGMEEFADSSEIAFFNGIFSTEIQAELYSNTLYRIEFVVCSANNCENFGFNFFTWKRLWNE